MSFVFLLLLVMPQIAYSQWESSLQYRTPQKENLLRETVPLYLSEMQSDIVAYQKSPTWLKQWNLAQNGLSLSMGSLNWFTLFADNQVKISHSVDDNLIFRAHFIEENDLESQYNAAVFEFEKKIGAFGFVLNGVPNPNKAESDIGIAGAFATDRFQIRIFQNFFDIPRNKHNSENDSFSKTYPFVMGIVASSSDRLWNLGLRVLPQIDWNFPDTQQAITVSEMVAQAEAFLPIGRHLLHLQMQNDVFEKRVTNRSSHTIDLHMKRTRSLARLRWEQELTSTDSLLLGLEFALRSWNREQTQVWVTHGYWQTAIFEQWKARLGGDASRYRCNHWDTEFRLNTALEYGFSASTEILFQATFDLDEPGMKRRFQGGNVQFNLQL